MMKTLLATSSLLLGSTLAETLMGTATFDMGNIRGTIKFVQEDNGVVTMVSDLAEIQVGAEPTVQAWHIHDRPLREMDCLSAGPHFNMGDKRYGELSETFGDIVFTDGVYKQNASHAELLPVTGQASILGRSIVLHGPEETKPRVACATIVPTVYDPAKVRVARATFLGEHDDTIVGHITFRQQYGEKGTQVIVDMMDRNSKDHKWHIHVDPRDDSKDAGDLCTSTGGHLDPAGVEVDGYTCDPASPELCYMGDMSGKHGALDLTDATGKLTVFTDETLDMFGENSIVYRGLTLHAEDLGKPRVACATIQDVEPLQYSAMFPALDGRMSFSQISEYDPTQIKLTWNTTAAAERTDTSYSWHVHEFPLPRATRLPAIGPNACGAAATGGHWNPKAAAAGFNDVTQSHDESELGDLNARLGPIAVTDAAPSWVDWYTQLHGRYGVGGMSIVLHDNEGERMHCATLGIEQSAVGLGAFFGELTFTLASEEDVYGVTGSVAAKPSPDGGVLITADLASTAAGAASKYGIRILNKQGNGDNCNSLTTVFNPENIAGQTCSPQTPETSCAAGDLTGKHFPANEAQTIVSGIGIGKTTIYDPFLSIHDIKDLGIAIYDPENVDTKISCGLASVGQGDKAVMGYMHFTQTKTMYQFSPVSMYSSLADLRANPQASENNWHVHENKVDAETHVCTSTGAHHDPFRNALFKDNGLISTHLIPFNFEAGDVTAQSDTFPLAGTPARWVGMGNNAPLSGPFGFQGKSITIHDGTTAPRIACADLEPVCPIRYTVCDTLFQDCDKKLGKGYSCIEMTAGVKKERCTFVSGDCRSIQCFEGVEQTEYPQRSGVCVPKSSNEFLFSVEGVDREIIGGYNPALRTDPPVPIATNAPAPGGLGSGDGKVSGNAGAIVGGIIGALVVGGAAFVAVSRRNNAGPHMDNGMAMKDEDQKPVGMVSYDVENGAEHRSVGSKSTNSMGSGAPPERPPKSSPRSSRGSGAPHKSSRPRKSKKKSIPKRAEDIL